MDAERKGLVNWLNRLAWGLCQIAIVVWAFHYDATYTHVQNPLAVLIFGVVMAVVFTAITGSLIDWTARQVARIYTAFR